MPDRPEDRRLLEEIAEAVYEASGPSWDETVPLAERILELVSLDAERREKDKAGPRCALCGKVRDDHTSHQFVMPRPEGCVCGNDRPWNWEPPPICGSFRHSSIVAPGECGNCCHDAACHRRRAYQRPSVSTGFYSIVRDRPGLMVSMLLEGATSIKRALMESGVGDVDAGRAARRLAEECNGTRPDLAGE